MSSKSEIISIKRQESSTDQSSQKSTSQKKTHIVNLPSKGIFYPSDTPLSSGTVELNHVTVKHEDILTNKNFMNKGTALDEFLKSLISNTDISIDDLLVCDKDALLLEARGLAYGYEYQFDTKCPVCGETSKQTVDFSKLGDKEIDTSKITKGENKISFKLPISGKEIQFKFLTSRDESTIDAELKILSKNGQVSPEIATRLKYSIVSIEGSSDKIAIKKFVDSMSSKDSLELRKYIKKMSPSKNLTYDFECPSCGHTEKMPIRIDTDFFWPSLSENE